MKVAPTKMNKYNPKKHNRRSIRLKGYDYSQAGQYFITTCIQNRACLLGRVEDGAMQLNDAGKMVKEEWLKLLERFPNIRLHEFVVMPNHFHGILEIVDGPPLGQPQGIGPTEVGPKRKTLGDMVGAFGSITTGEYIRGVKNHNWQRFDRKLWQRNYWEHIIRNENAFNNISQYIKNNPRKWQEDKLNGGKGNIVLEPPVFYGEENWMV